MIQVVGDNYLFSKMREKAVVPGFVMRRKLTEVP